MCADNVFLYATMDSVYEGEALITRGRRDAFPLVGDYGFLYIHAKVPIRHLHEVWSQG